LERLFNYDRATAAYDMIEAAKRIEALEAALRGWHMAGDVLNARIEALEAALQQVANWVQQNPEANAGDRAGDELLDIVRGIAALAPEQETFA
jgi:outer membrane PBP1 activator LpoA protein